MDFSQIPLRDIHLPEIVGWWPPAPGWWLIAAVGLGLIGFMWFRYRQRYRERAALKGLKRALAALDKGQEPVQCLQQMSMTMRRFAMSVSSNVQPIGGLTGEGWLQFLDSRWGRDVFSRGVGRALIVAPYTPADRVMYGDVHELGSLCVEWVNAQREKV